jgi:hypothetical protein
MQVALAFAEVDTLLVAGMTEEAAEELHGRVTRLLHSALMPVLDASGLGTLMSARDIA